MEQFLTTKLYPQKLRASLVPRLRLINKLNSGKEGKLTLVSSPAGFGKSTLISSWIHQLDRPATWVSLDQGDNTPSQFLKYFIAALQVIGVEIGEVWAQQAAFWSAYERVGVVTTNLICETQNEEI